MMMLDVWGTSWVSGEGHVHVDLGSAAWLMDLQWECAVDVQEVKTG